MLNFTNAFAEDLRFSFSVTNLLLGFIVLFFASGTIFMWITDKPKSERFWFISGIACHWSATVIARIIDLMRENGGMLVRNAHLLTTFNMCLVFAAGIFYIRALSQHIWPNLWRNMMYALMGLSLLLYTCKFMVCDDKPKKEDICFMNLWGM